MANDTQEPPWKEGRDPEIHRLVTRFLEMTVGRGMGPDEAGEKVGRTGEGVRIWIRGEFTTTNHATKKRLREYVEGRPADAGPGWDEGYRAAITQMRAALDELDATSEDEARGALRGKRATGGLPPTPPPSQEETGEQG